MQLVGIKYSFSTKFVTFCYNFESIVVEKTKKTVKVEASTVEIEEKGVKLRLTVVDTPGYGDGIDNSDRYFIRVLK